MNVCVCIGCGCDDENPCQDMATGAGCSWLRVDRDQQLGVCSCCTEDVKRWDAGDRDATEEAMEAFAERAGEEESDDDEPRILMPGDFGFDETLRSARRR